MKMNQFLKMNASALLLAGMAMFGSCSKSSDSISSDDSQNVNTESVADNQISETSDLSTSVVSNITNTQYGTGRATGVILGLEAKDPRLTGAAITITPGANSTKDAPNGTITIDFGAGQTYNGVTRKGQIIITYNGRKGVTGSTRVLTYNNYSRNGIMFDNGMTFTHTNITDSTVFHHQLSGGKLTFPDNTTISRTADYDVTIDYINKTLTLSAHSGAAHSATGTNRKGKDYTMDITSPIVYKAECASSKIFLAASGKKTITAGLVTYTIDYGDGTCDNTITITVGGKTFTITVSADGN